MGTRLWLLLAAGLFPVASGGAFANSAATPRLVVKLTIATDINPATAGYIARGIGVAERRGAELALIQLDTPGGQMVSMGAIIAKILGSSVPVAVWVAPEGARAASAGTFILYASHIAGMAPSTTVGAAHPVMIAPMPAVPGPPGEEGGAPPPPVETMTEKIVNDAAAQIRGLATRRGRNADWAETAVRESVSATAEEALRLGVIELIAATAEEFLAKADGRTVQLQSGSHTLALKGAVIEPLEMSWRESLLAVIGHPNIAYLLFVIGIYAIILELKTPSFGGAGTVGIIALVLGLYALSVLPVNWAGLALILVGVGFLVAELYTPTSGVLGISGLIAFVIGSLILIDAPAMQVSRPLIAGVAAGTAAFFLFALAAVVQGQRRPVAIGTGALVGRTGTVRELIDPVGVALIDGALWTVVTDQEPVEPGETVVVVEELPHLRLKVRRKETAASG